jgi:hypothetical protein
MGRRAHADPSSAGFGFKKQPSSGGGSKDKNEGLTPHQLKLARKAVAEETLSILRKGVYVPDEKTGTEFEINSKVSSSVDAAVCYLPEDDIPLPELSSESLMMVEGKYYRGMRFVLDCMVIF